MLSMQLKIFDFVNISKLRIAPAVQELSMYYD